MNSVIFPNQTKNARIKSAVFSAITIIYTGLGLYLISRHYISTIPFSIGGLGIIALIIFFGRRAQWELASNDSLTFEIYFRIGNFLIKRRSFKKTEIKELLIEQDNRKYFILYLVLARQRIKIERSETRNAIEDLRDRLADTLHWHYTKM